MDGEDLKNSELLKLIETAQLSKEKATSTIFSSHKLISNSYWIQTAQTFLEAFSLTEEKGMSVLSVIFLKTQKSGVHFSFGTFFLCFFKKKKKTFIKKSHVVFLNQDNSNLVYLRLSIHS